jgi:hypothetical protein
MPRSPACPSAVGSIVKVLTHSQLHATIKLFLQSPSTRPFRLERMCETGLDCPFTSAYIIEVPVSARAFAAQEKL